MKTIDYIVGGIFILLIGAKLWIIPNVEEIVGIPIDLYILHIVGWLVLIGAIATIRFRKRHARKLIVMVILFALAENIWRYRINDIGIGGLTFTVLGYLFLSWILWFWTNSGCNKSDDKTNEVITI